MAFRTSRWPAGTPSWADLGTPDVVEASAFYTVVLGWEIPEPDEQWGGYVVASVEDGSTAGIGPLSEGQPSAWTLYFATDDADATAAAITSNGGTVVVDPFDVGDLGRMAVAIDPTGAQFGIWQANTFIGAQTVNEPGGLVWEDLRSPDPKAAWAFYNAVFGHQVEPLPDAGPDYGTFRLPADGGPLGGMGGMFGASAPGWVLYFQVEDLDLAAEQTVAMGGAELSRDLGTPFGDMVTVQDPWGATFILFAPAPGPVPDRNG